MNSLLDSRDEPLDHSSAQVLVVDDDAVTRHLVVDQREQENLVVHQAEDGKEGLELLRRHQPQLILLDYHMPHMNGIDFLRQVESEGVQSHSVIMLTSTDDQQVISDCYQLGVHAFMVKPVNYLILKGQVKRALALNRYARDLRRQIQTTERHSRLLRTVFDSIPEGVIVLDHNLRVRMISAKACTILGVPKSAVLSLRVNEVLGEAFTEPGAPLDRCVATDSKLTNIQTHVERSPGTTIPIALTINRFSPNDKQPGWILLFRDLRQEEHKLFALSDKERFGRMISGDLKMKEVFDLIDKVADTHATVLIIGESGTGKELVARELHDRSNRKRHTFLAVNCAAIPAELLESEFFGHEKGSFTGAGQTKIGRFEMAHGGTLFLDEIGEMPYGMQGKLLRVLQERKFMRVGGNRTIEVDVRIVAATNKDLKKLVQENRFREDLYYRLAVIPIHLPPLRERILDVPHLVHYFIEVFKKRRHTQVKYMSSDVLQRLMEHNWPGNVRELVNVLEYSFAVCSDSTLHLEHLPKEMQTRTSGVQMRPPANTEKDHILRTLESVNFRKGLAAAKLGINPSTLYRKMKKFGID